MTEENSNQSLIARLKNRRTRIRLIGIVAGLVGGYVYYRTIGCTTGSCPLTSNPWLSMIWGGLLGYLIADLFNKPASGSKKHENTELDE